MGFRTRLKTRHNCATSQRPTGPIYGLVVYGLVTQRFVIEPKKGAVLPVASQGSVLETGGSWPNELFDVPASGGTDGTPSIVAVILCATRWTITRCGLLSFTKGPLVVTWQQLRALSEVSMKSAPLSSRMSQNVSGCMQKVDAHEAR